MKLYTLTADGFINCEVNLSPFIGKHEGNLVIEVNGAELGGLPCVKLQISPEDALLLMSNLSSALLSLTRNK